MVNLNLWIRNNHGLKDLLRMDLNHFHNYQRQNQQKRYNIQIRINN